MKAEISINLPTTEKSFVNVEVIKQGYVFAYTPFSFKYLDEFRRYEREARKNKRRLRKRCNFKFPIQRIGRNMRDIRGLCKERVIGW
jgi:endonuclease YncB( thermonuclease family)